MRRRVSVRRIALGQPVDRDAAGVHLQGRGAKVGNGAAAPATSSGLHRTHIPTPDSRSPVETTSYGWKYGRLGRSCSGSLDRLVLGHLCTDEPLDACKSIARVRGRTIGPGSWAAGHAVHTWGTAGKQRQVSHARAARAPATRKAHHHGAVEVQWRPLGTPVAGAA